MKCYGGIGIGIFYTFLYWRASSSQKKPNLSLNADIYCTILLIQTHTQVKAGVGEGESVGKSAARAEQPAYYQI